MSEVKQNKALSAVAKIMGEVGSVKKEGFNEFHRYKYAAAADVMHALQPLLAKHGLTIIQNQRGLEFIQDGAALAIAYEFFVCHESGDTLPIVPVHTGVAAAKTSKGSFDDKAANKCHTAARKYFLLSLFQIPTGDYADPDADGDVPESKAKIDKEAAKRAIDDKKKADEKPAAGLWLQTSADGAGETHGAVGAFLDALEGHLSNADDPAELFGYNEPLLQRIQGAAAKKKDDAVVGRIAAIFSHIHAGTVPGAGMP